MVDKEWVFDIFCVRRLVFGVLKFFFDENYVLENSELLYRSWELWFILVME